MKTKKLLACILSLAMILTTLSFTAFAEETQSMTFAEFLQVMKSNDYNYDFNGATIKIITDKFCVNPDHSSGCPDGYTYVADKDVVPARIQGTNAQYQPFNGLDKDITIKNAKFVADVTKGVGLKLKNNSGWEGTIEAGEPVNVELQINNSKSLTIEGCEFDGVNVAPYHNGNDTSDDVVDTFFGNTFKNIYNAYGIQGIRGGKSDVRRNSFNNCTGGIYVERSSNGINIAENTFENMGKNCPEDKIDTKIGSDIFRGETQFRCKYCNCQK